MLALHFEAFMGREWFLKSLFVHTVEHTDFILKVVSFDPFISACFLYKLDNRTLGIWERVRSIFNR